MNREQLSLFPEEQRELIVGVDKMDLSKLPDDPYRVEGKGYQHSMIVSNTYFIYKTGGFHFDKKYKDHGLVYPYIKNENTGKILKIGTRYSDPYPKFTMNIYIDGEKKASMLKIHRLTAFAFIKRPDDPKYVVVDHINGNIMDYRLDNLRWSTISQNVNTAGKRDDEKTANLFDALAKERSKNEME